MNYKKADEIFIKVTDEWKRREPNKKIDEKFLLQLREFLGQCPDEDGFKRVTDMSTGLTHLVPYEDMILNGLRGDNLDKYPLAEAIKLPLHGIHQQANDWVTCKCHKVFTKKQFLKHMEKVKNGQ